MLNGFKALLASEYERIIAVAILVMVFIVMEKTVANIARLIVHVVGIWASYKLFVLTQDCTNIWFAVALTYLTLYIYGLFFGHILWSADSNILLLAILAGLTFLGARAEYNKYSTSSPVVSNIPSGDDSFGYSPLVLGRWRMTWSARQGEKTSGVGDRVGSCEVGVLEYSATHFSIETRTPPNRPSSFEWDKTKNPDSGTWVNHYPGDSGKWYLKRTAQNSFAGWYTDSAGGTLDLWLTR